MKERKWSRDSIKDFASSARKIFMLVLSGAFSKLITALASSATKLPGKTARDTNASLSLGDSLRKDVFIKDFNLE